MSFTIELKGDGFNRWDVQELYENLVRALREAPDDGTFDGTLTVLDDEGKALVHILASEVADVSDPADVDPDGDPQDAPEPEPGPTTAEETPVT